MSTQEHVNQSTCNKYSESLNSPLRKLPMQLLNENASRGVAPLHDSPDVAPSTPNECAMMLWGHVQAQTDHGDVVTVSNDELDHSVDR